MEKKLQHINEINLSERKESWDESLPFNHISIDDFLKEEIIEEVVKEFPLFNDESWRVYNNPIEVKKLQNHWDKFGPTTYKLFQYLNSREFIAEIEKLTGCELYADFGLNGGGLHTHKRGGKLNTHLDYAMHPKLGLERRINLLIYVTPGWKEEWGGSLGLWEQDEFKKSPGKLVSTIVPKYNRAVIFDTTQNSWHGLPEPILCPEDVTRNSLAVYYLCKPRAQVENRGKALFAPHKEQINDPEILELIKARSQISTASSVYGDKIK